MDMWWLISRLSDRSSPSHNHAAVTPTILVIDDTPSSVAMIRHALGGDFRVLTALTGEEGIEIAERERPDAVLLDVMLPFMDGFAVCEQIRKTKSLFGVPVVMISVLDDRASRLAGLEAGADDFISKPFDRLELKLRLRTIVKMNRFRRLLTAREQFELVFLASPDPTMLVDRESWAVSLANVAAHEQLDLRHDFLGAVIPEGRTALLQRLSALEAGQPASVTVKIAGARGGFVTMDGMFAATEWEERPSLIVSLRSADARLRAEARQQQDERVKSALAASAGLAHDFGNYLMSIQGGLELVGKMIGAHPEAQSILSSVDATAEQAFELVKRTTTLAQGLATLNLQPVELPALVRQLEPSLRHLLGDIALVLTIRTNGRPVIADFKQMERVIMNLVANARDAIRGAGTVEVTVAEKLSELTPGGTEMRLSVRDTGCGMSDEVKARMFEPYFTTRAGRGGTGLGLATVYRIVTLHGGQVSVESKIGAGTTVTLGIPCPDSERTDAADGVGVARVS